MVACDYPREVDPNRSQDERRLVVAFRALPRDERADALRRLELQSMNRRGDDAASDQRGGSDAES